MQTLNKILKLKEDTYNKLLQSGIAVDLAEKASELTYQINVLSATPEDLKNDANLKAEFERFCRGARNDENRG